VNTTTDITNRRNPAVLAQAAKCFTAIVKALEAETLQGQTATRIVGAAKQLLQLAGLDGAQLLASMPPETQQTVRAFFG
jgi:urease accessory protein UreF